VTLPGDAAAPLRTVAELRALCLRLPHVPTPGELTRLARFETLVAAPAAATRQDIEALVAGWTRWWREARAEALLEMAAGLPAGLVEGDRRLASLLVAAKHGATDSPSTPLGERAG